MNASLLRTLSQRRPCIRTPSQGQNTTFDRMDSLRKETINRKMTILVLKVVGFLMVCYIPLLAWRHHYYSVVVYRENSLLTDTEVYICQFKNNYLILLSLITWLMDWFNISIDNHSSFLGLLCCHNRTLICTSNLHQSIYLRPIDSFLFKRS